MKTLINTLAVAALLVTASTASAQSNDNYTGYTAPATGYAQTRAYNPQYTPQNYYTNDQTPCQVKGDNVSMVIYSCSGRVCGTIVEIGQGRWIERSDDGRFEFTEIQRDEWSVYLRKSDGAFVQLDLYRKAVSVNGSDLYQIVKSVD